MACEKGYISQKGYDYCIPCSEGFYSNENNTECIECPEGYISSKNSSNCSKCEEGLFSIKGHTICSKCLEDEYFDFESNSCMNLINDTYPVKYNINSTNITNSILLSNKKSNTESYSKIGKNLKEQDISNYLIIKISNLFIILLLF